MGKGSGRACDQDGGADGGRDDWFERDFFRGRLDDGIEWIGTGGRIELADERCRAAGSKGRSGMTVEVAGGALPPEEIERYKAYMQEKYPNRRIEKLTLTVDGDYVEIGGVFAHAPFDRIRRITGYLVGTMDHWNNAKRAEERDRVKHS